MNRFIDVTMPDPNTSPACQQEAADREFPSIARSLGFRIWKPEDPITSKGRRVLIGVATYSTRDMQLLDELTPLLPQGGGSSPRVELFNVRDVRSMSDFAAYVPGVGSVFQTPVAAIWVNGTLVERATGSAAREAILRWLSERDNGVVHAPVTPTRTV